MMQMSVTEFYRKSRRTITNLDKIVTDMDQLVYVGSDDITQRAFDGKLLHQFDLAVDGPCEVVDDGLDTHDDVLTHS